MKFGMSLNYPSVPRSLVVNGSLRPEGITKGTLNGSRPDSYMAKGFTQRECIEYHETYSPVSKKDSYRIVMEIVAHFNLELDQMDVKTMNLNGDLEKEVYMEQLEGFVKENENKLVCKLKKSIYGLKQASRQWYLKFNRIISSFGFTKKVVDHCIYISRLVGADL